MSSIPNIEQDSKKSLESTLSNEAASSGKTAPVSPHMRKMLPMQWGTQEQQAKFDTAWNELAAAERAKAIPAVGPDGTIVIHNTGNPWSNETQRYDLWSSPERARSAMQNAYKMGQEAWKTNTSDIGRQENYWKHAKGWKSWPIVKDLAYLYGGGNTGMDQRYQQEMNERYGANTSDDVTTNTLNAMYLKGLNDSARPEAESTAINSLVGQHVASRLLDGGVQQWDAPLRVTGYRTSDLGNSGVTTDELVQQFGDEMRAKYGKAKGDAMERWARVGGLGAWLIGAGGHMYVDSKMRTGASNALANSSKYQTYNQAVNTAKALGRNGSWGQQLLVVGDKAMQNSAKATRTSGFGELGDILASMIDLGKGDDPAYHSKIADAMRMIGTGQQMAPVWAAAAAPLAGLNVTARAGLERFASTGFGKWLTGTAPMRWTGKAFTQAGKGWSKATGLWNTAGKALQPAAGTAAGAAGTSVAKKMAVEIPKYLLRPGYNAMSYAGNFARGDILSGPGMGLIYNIESFLTGKKPDFSLANYTGMTLPVVGHTAESIAANTNVGLMAFGKDEGHKAQKELDASLRAKAEQAAGKNYAQYQKDLEQWRHPGQVSEQPVTHDIIQPPYAFTPGMPGDNTLEVLGMGITNNSNNNATGMNRMNRSYATSIGNGANSVQTEMNSNPKKSPLPIFSDVILGDSKKDEIYDFSPSGNLDPDLISPVRPLQNQESRTQQSALPPDSSLVQEPDATQDLVPTSTDYPEYPSPDTPYAARLDQMHQLLAAQNFSTFQLKAAQKLDPDFDWTQATPEEVAAHLATFTPEQRSKAKFEQYRIMARGGGSLDPRVFLDPDMDKQQRKQLLTMHLFSENQSAGNGGIIRQGFQHLMGNDGELLKKGMTIPAVRQSMVAYGTACFRDKLNKKDSTDTDPEDVALQQIVLSDMTDQEKATMLDPLWDASIDQVKDLFTNASNNEYAALRKAGADILIQRCANDSNFFAELLPTWSTLVSNGTNVTPEERADMMKQFTGSVNPDELVKDMDDEHFEGLLRFAFSEKGQEMMSSTGKDTGEWMKSFNDEAKSRSLGLARKKPELWSLLSGLYLQSKGWKSVGNFIGEPMNFWGAFALLALGGIWLASSLFSGDKSGNKDANKPEDALTRREQQRDYMSNEII